ncbi:MAG: type I glutamate--ammonia ligase [Planctomycetales bacterium]|nr:type I glutamate--ammonia ligase [Planctomycetales bacterium]
MERRFQIRSPQEVLSLCRERDVKAVDLRFTDFFGRQHHLTIPVSDLTEVAFEDGFSFSGSNVRFWQSVDESDLLLIPLPSTAWIDPFATIPTLAITCSIQDPITREDYDRDPRLVALRAENYLIHTGVADQVQLSPEIEFFIFDNIKYHQTAQAAYYEVDSIEAAWNVGRNDVPNLGHKIDYRQGYLACPPVDQTDELRTEIMQTLIECGVDVVSHRHASATAGQVVFDLQHESLLLAADSVMKFKYVCKNLAEKHQRSATFMPKPILGDNGSGMHVQMSLWKNGEPLFAGKGYGGLSEIGQYAIGGILRHTPALLAFTNPTTNSYKRLVPGYDAPTHIAYSQRNRSAACRIPVGTLDPRSKRMEYRCPDPAANPYLSFAAILMAAIDGVQNKIHPGPPMDRDLYDLPPEILQDVVRLPKTLDAALSALENDADFLLRGDVLSEASLQGWIEYKRQSEVAQLEMRPHPYEFCMYYDT